MQHFIDLAIKNGVTLLNTGKCQFCGAEYQNGVFECIDSYNNGLEFLNLNNPEYHLSRFLSVDAHALQHPEIHGRWSNHFHLSRLNLILDKGIVWNYTKSPQLSDFLNEYKLSRPDEFLLAPAAMNRGKIKSTDLARATTANECVDLIKRWASGVYDAWRVNHPIVSQIADGFINKMHNQNYSGRKTTIR